MSCSRLVRRFRSGGWTNLVVGECMGLRHFDGGDVMTSETFFA